MKAMGFVEQGNALVLPSTASLSPLCKALDLLQRAEPIRKVIIVGKRLY